MKRGVVISAGRSGFVPPVRASFLPALLLCVGVPGVAAQDTGAPERVEIRGRVVDTDTGEPIQGAYISFKDRDWGVLTDDEGRFVLKADRSARYWVITENLGYEPLEFEILDPEPDPLEVRIKSSPIQLEGIRVMADRFRSRRRSVSTSVRAFDRVDLLTSPSRDMADFLQSRLGRPLRQCPFRSAFASMCTFRRGRLTPVQVYIDEMPTFGGVAELESYRPQELFLLEVYGGGTQVRIYTTYFMDRIAKSGKLLNPIPIW